MIHSGDNHRLRSARARRTTPSHQHMQIKPGARATSVVHSAHSSVAKQTGCVCKTNRRSCMRNSHHHCTKQLADQTPRPSRRAQTHAAAARLTDTTAQALGALRTEPPPGNRIHALPRLRCPPAKAWAAAAACRLAGHGGLPAWVSLHGCGHRGLLGGCCCAALDQLLQHCLPLLGRLRPAQVLVDAGLDHVPELASGVHLCVCMCRTAVPTNMCQLVVVERMGQVSFPAFDLASSQCCLCSQKKVFTAAPTKTPTPGRSGQRCAVPC